MGSMDEAPPGSPTPDGASPTSLASADGAAAPERAALVPTEVPESPGEGDGADHRVHARIGVSTQIEVNGPDGLSPAELRDLSKGGARFFTPANLALGNEGDTIELFLPSLTSGDIAVMAQIIRVREVDDGRLYGVRFDAVEPALQKGLSDLVELLLDTGALKRDLKPRRVRRIEVHPAARSELRGTLADIASGTLLMTLGDPLSLYEDVEVVLPDLAGHELLVVPGRVAHQRKVERTASVQFQVGIDFHQVRPEARACLEALMSTIDTAVHDGVPDGPLEEKTVENVAPKAAE